MGSFPGTGTFLVETETSLAVAASPSVYSVAARGRACEWGQVCPA